MSAPVFLHPEVTGVSVGSTVVLTGPEARHAGTVQRRTIGETIDLVDGLGNRLTGSISAVSDAGVSVEVTSVSADWDAPIVLVQALAKNGRDEQAIEAATELGVTGIIPWAAERSIVRWKGPKIDKGRGAWVSVVTAAAKQSRRALIPAVEELASTAQLAVQVRDAVAAGIRVLVLHESASTRLDSIKWESADTPVWLIVGPEGGISDKELDLLAAAGGEPALLGPYVLRASSAGPAAIAALAAIRGNWKRSDSTQLPRPL